MIKAEKQIQIGGKKRLMKMGTNSTAIFCEMHNIPLADFQSHFENMGMLQFRDLVYACLKDGARKEGKDFNVSPDDVGDWLDEDGVTEAVMDFMNSINAPSEAKGSQKSGSKKK